MRKFSEIEHQLNEEFLNILNKGKEEEVPQKFVKTSKELIEMYSRNLVSEDLISVDAREKEMFNFAYYKIKSISKLGTRKFNVSMVTYDSTKRAVGELNYLLEI